MKLSIVLPVYNVSPYIERCLNSIINQITEDVELILVDDESPDNSILIAEQFLSKNLCSYQIIHQKNKGLGGARNTGLLNSRGDYVWFVDSDDVICEDCIDKVLYSINNQDLVIFDYESINAKGLVSQTYKKCHRLDDCSGAEVESYFVLSQAWRSIYSRKFLLNHEIFFREHFLHEDGEFNMRVMFYAKNISYIPNVIYRYYTQNGSSIMNNIKFQNQEDLIKYFDSAKDLVLRNSNATNDQKKVIFHHLRSAMAVLFINVTRLSDTDMPRFRDLIKKNRKRMLKIANYDCNIYENILYLVKVMFPYKFLYNIIFNKHF